MKHCSIESLEHRRLFSTSHPFLDTTYGSGGATTLRFKPVDGSTAVTSVQLEAASDGGTYVMARTGTAVQIRRLTDDGQIDTN